MSKADLSAIHDQTDFSKVPQLSFQPTSSNRLVPFPHSDGWIIQQPAQAPGSREQLGWSRDISGNTAQTNRPALKNPYHQPDKGAHLGDPLVRSQFHYSAFPGIIKTVGRHWITPFLKRFRKTNFSGESLPINYSVVKVSGS
jgi:hypothetical protein